MRVPRGVVHVHAGISRGRQVRVAHVRAPTHLLHAPPAGLHHRAQAQARHRLQGENISSALQRGFYNYLNTRWFYSRFYTRYIIIVLEAWITVTFKKSTTTLLICTARFINISAFYLSSIITKLTYNNNAIACPVL